jgi:hypothetical protein
MSDEVIAGHVASLAINRREIWHTVDRSGVHKLMSDVEGVIT